MGFRLLPEAESDLDEIWLYIAKNSSSIEIANRLIDTITDRFWLLGQQPQIGRSRDHDLRAGLRSFPVGAYMIFYRIEGSEVLIHHVMQASRDIEGILND